MIGLTNDRSIFLSPPELLRSISWRYRPWGSLHQVPVVFISVVVYKCGAHRWCHIFQLARYLNRTYWEKKQEEARKSPTPSAPAPVPLAEPPPAVSQPVESHVPAQPANIVEVWRSEQEAGVWSCVVDVLDPDVLVSVLALHFQQQYQNGESEENHEQFLKALQNAVTTFLNRMKSNHMRGRSITNDSAVLSLFQSINNMHPQLLDILNQLDEKRR